MLDTFFGTKLHQTQVWDQAGVRLPVTIIKTAPMKVTQVKTNKQDGYQAIQVGFGSKKWQLINRPIAGHIKKSNSKDKKGAKASKSLAPRFLREIRIDDDQQINPGDTFSISDVLKSGDKVNATSISHGKGFAGVVKRYGFAGGPRTHGQSDRERAPGSIGQGTDPGRVHKGKKMPGHMGAAQVTVRNLTVVRVDDQKGELWLKGQVPGAYSVVRLKKVGKDKKFPGLLDPNQKQELSQAKPKDKKPVEKS